MLGAAMFLYEIGNCHIIRGHLALAALYVLNYRTQNPEILDYGGGKCVEKYHQHSREFKNGEKRGDNSSFGVGPAHVERNHRFKKVGYEAGYEEWQQDIAQLRYQKPKDCGDGQPDNQMHYAVGSPVFFVD